MAICLRIFAASLHSCSFPRVCLNSNVSRIVKNFHVLRSPSSFDSRETAPHLCDFKESMVSFFAFSSNGRARFSKYGNVSRDIDDAVTLNAFFTKLDSTKWWVTILENHLSENFKHRFLILFKKKIRFSYRIKI